MNRRVVTIALALLLAIAASWALHRLTRPYDPGSPPVDGTRVTGASLTRDRSFHWLAVELDGGIPADGMPPAIRLRDSDGVLHDSAEWQRPAAGGSGETRGTLRFWLDSRQLAGTLTLELPGGSLAVKRSTGIPPVADGRTRRFRTSNW